MRSAFLIAKKDTKSLLNEKTLVLSILIQLLIASFSSFLVVGLTSVSDPDALSEFDVRGVNLGVVHTDSTNSTNLALYNDLIDNSRLYTTVYRNFSTAMNAFYRGEIDGILLLPNVAINGSEFINLLIYLPETDLKATIVTLQLKEPLEQFEQRVRDHRTKRLPDYKPLALDLPVRHASSFHFELIYIILIPLLVFTPVFISGGLVLDSLTEEFEQKTIDLLLMSPITFMDILNGKMLVAVLIAPIQVFSWLALLAVNGIRVDNMFMISVFATLMTFILVVISVFIAIKLNDRRTSQLFYSLVLVTLFLLSQVVPGSPLNLVTKFACGTIGGDIAYVGVYACIAVGLYAALRRYTP